MAVSAGSGIELVGRTGDGVTEGAGSGVTGAIVFSCVFAAPEVGAAGGGTADLATVVDFAGMALGSRA